ncbi:hypothetical protein [uncultured Flavobacterium sp.]|uniref:hypothetical protein n=1 Tax=uncultured Flavobacterium sp. TaxID=165435 RepID=UPI0030EDE9F0|tara:strand:+ start:2438 stop:2617 length:180 start_codon:yes stop_codon:yes gene_type:complete
MKNNIGKQVSTPYGNGVITAIDLPNSDRSSRYLITLEDPSKFGNNTPCFFPEDENFKIL